MCASCSTQVTRQHSALERQKAGRQPGRCLRHVCSATGRWLRSVGLLARRGPSRWRVGHGSNHAAMGSRPASLFVHARRARACAHATSVQTSAPGAHHARMSTRAASRDCRDHVAMSCPQRDWILRRCCAMCQFMQLIWAHFLSWKPLAGGMPCARREVGFGERLKVGPLGTARGAVQGDISGTQSCDYPASFTVGSLRLAGNARPFLCFAFPCLQLRHMHRA